MGLGAWSGFGGGSCRAVPLSLENRTPTIAPGFGPVAETAPNRPAQPGGIGVMKNRRINTTRLMTVISPDGMNFGLIA